MIRNPRGLFTLALLVAAVTLGSPSVTISRQAAEDTGAVSLCLGGAPGVALRDNGGRLSSPVAASGCSGGRLALTPTYVGAPVAVAAYNAEWPDSRRRHLVLANYGFPVPRHDDDIPLPPPAIFHCDGQPPALPDPSQFNPDKSLLLKDAWNGRYAACLQESPEKKNKILEALGNALAANKYAVSAGHFRYASDGELVAEGRRQLNQDFCKNARDPTQGYTKPACRNIYHEVVETDALLYKLVGDVDASLSGSPSAPPDKVAAWTRARLAALDAADNALKTCGGDQPDAALVSTCRDLRNQTSVASSRQSVCAALPAGVVVAGCPAH